MIKLGLCFVCALWIIASMTHRMKYNPFGQPPDTLRAELAVVEVAPLVEFLRKPGKRVIEVVGQSGRGKTTLMRAVREAFAGQQHWWKLESRNWQRPPLATVMWIDEAQRMLWWQRLMVFRHAQTLMLTTHRSLEGPLKRAGFEYRQVCVQGLTAQALSEIIARRIRWSGHSLTVAPQVVEALLEHYGDDLRAIFDMLYEMFRVMPNGQATLQWPPEVGFAPPTPPY